MIALVLFIVSGVLFALTELSDSNLLAWGLVALASGHVAAILEGRKP